MTNFFQLPLALRATCASYLYSYQTANTEERACYELLSLLPENSLDKVASLFDQKIKELHTAISPQKVTNNCLAVLTSSNKKERLYLGSQFRIVPHPSFTPNFGELFFQFQESIYQLKSTDGLQVEKTVKLIAILASKENHFNPQKVLRAAIKVLDDSKQVICESKSYARTIAIKLSLINRISCSTYFRMKEFIETRLNFLAVAKKFHLLIEVKGTKYGHYLAIPTKDQYLHLFEKMIVSKNLEERSFCYRWINLSKEAEMNGTGLSSNLTKEELADFKKRFLTHKNPNIRQLAEFCVDNCEQQSLYDLYQNNLFTFIQSFLVIYTNKDSFSHFTKNLFLDAPEFMIFFNEVEKELSFLDLPDPNKISQTVELKVKDYLTLCLERSLNLEAIKIKEDQALKLKKELNQSIEFLYKTTFLSLMQLEKVIRGKKIKGTDCFKEYFSSPLFKRNASNITLPAPDALERFFNHETVMEYEIEQEKIIREEKSQENKWESDTKETSVVLKSKEPNLLELLNIRDFPLHDLPYDKRVIERFLQLNGDFAKASWEVQSHAFPDFIDRFVGTIYSIKTAGWHNEKTNHTDPQYLLFADVLIGDEEFPVTIEYTKGKDRLWYHRYMNRAPRKDFANVMRVEREKSAQAAKGGKEMLPKQTGIMVFDPVTESVRVNFKTFEIRLHRLR